MAFYPPEIAEKLRSVKFGAKDTAHNAAGVAVGFECGSFVRFYLDIDTQTNEIRKAAFRSNGCGFAVAAAEVLAAGIESEAITTLHGFDGKDVGAQLEAELGEFPAGRAHCLAASVEALKAALADHRARRIEEFRGETALICTCFGIEEKTIENAIDRGAAGSVEVIARVTRAGSGCGSCRMLIQEMIDAREHETGSLY